MVFILFLFLFFLRMLFGLRRLLVRYGVFGKLEIYERFFFLYRVVLMFYFFLDLMRRGEKVCWNKVEVMLGDIGIMLNCVIDDEW